MSRKLLCLISFIVVLGMTAVSPAGLDDDPALEGWWKFDGDTTDSSGKGRDAELVGDAHLVDVGLHGGALSLDGSGDYAIVPSYKGINADRSDPNNPFNPAFSIALWCKTMDAQGALVTWGSSNGDGVGGQRQSFRINEGRLRAEHGNGNLQSDTSVNDGEWHHIVHTLVEGGNLRVPNCILYIDGVEDAIRGGSNNIFNLTEDNVVNIGNGASASGRLLAGDVDDVRIYSRVLDPNEVAELATRPKSYMADPAIGAQVEEVSYMLNWTAGDVAVEHDVYIGTTPDLGADQLLGRQAAGPILAIDLEKDTTYYWRVDDIAADGSVATGDTWNFWVPPRSAYDPSPVDGIMLLETTATLSWTGGWSPIMHNVHFGTDPAALVPVSMMQMDATYDTGTLELGTTYYWRIDEFYGVDTVEGPVWSFSTVPDVPMTDDPNLVVWLKMDEAPGGVVVDMSGYANHAVVKGDPQVVPGVDDGAMSFDGIDDYLDLGDNTINGIFDFNGVELTAVAWVNPSRLLPDLTNHNIGNVLLSRGSDPENDNFEFGFSEDGNAMIYTDTKGLTGSDHDTTRTVGNGEITVDEWHQFILVYDANAVDVYLDGIRYSTSVDGVSFDEADGSPFTVGDTLHIETPYGGLVDDLKIFDRAMSPDEVRQTYHDLALAYDPDPGAGSTDVSIVTTLSWLAGDGAAKHYVYLGTDPDAVAAANTSDTTGIYRRRQAGTSYTTETLEFGTDYYWRVDESSVYGSVVSTTTGAVWSFTTVDELVIFAEETPAPYDNTVDPFISAITLDLDPAQDWTDPITRVAFSYTGQPAPGSVTVDDVNTTIVGRGDDIWNTADQFQYAYTTLTGDGSMTVKVESLDATDNWTKAGIMIRETLDPGSAFAGVYFATTNNGVRFQARAMADTDATSDSSVATDEQKAMTLPVWLKIERMFPMINAYYSTDGVNFTAMSWNPQIIPMNPAAPVNIGLAVTSHSGDETYATAVFSEITSDGGVTPGPLTSVEIGDMSANSAEPMYAVLEDASGASAAVMNPDPAATQQSSATEWIVDLADFNVDLSALVKATLAVGNLDAPAPGGTGLITIHNVKLLGRSEPIGIWNLDEGSGATAGDSSGNGLDGAVIDANWASPGYDGAGSCLDFDGLGANMVDLGNFDVTTGKGLSISLWYKADNLDTPGNDPRMFSKAIGGSNEDHWFMLSSSRVGSDKVLRFRLKTDGTTGELKADTATGMIDLDVWTHVAAVWDGSAMKLYKNGVEAGSVDKGGTLSTNPDANVAIGNQPVGTDSRPWDGLIDEVKLYDRGLSAGEVAALAGL